jgi:Fe-S-cluster containining protein
MGEGISSGLIKFNIGGEPVTMKLDLSSEPVKPHRMLPVFQQLTNFLVNRSVEAIESKGEKISCAAGCGACCRQPVPISELEIYQLAELVENMPEPRRSAVSKRFADAQQHFAAIGWFDRIAACDAGGAFRPAESVVKELKKLVDDYFKEGVPCPFLENESCSIHQARPLVCREYLVTSPAENCRRENGAEIRRLGLFMSPSKTVQHIGDSHRMDDTGFVPLIRALEMAERFPEVFEEKKPGEWVDEFFDLLSRKPVPASKKKDAGPKKPRPERKRPR